MGILSGNPKQEPLHFGEIYGIWSSLSVAKAAIDAYQVYINHTGDEDLRGFLQDVMQSTIRPSIEDMEDILLHNEIAVPPTPADRPKADLEQIPAGARLHDMQIANTVAMDIGICLPAYSKLIAESIREDVGALFEKLHAKKVKDGIRLLRLMKEKGWIMPPPLHQETKQA
ncbi:DUF3231 family protein [Ectobacillus ponti]|uniref:DUF3231 family protein n=1 Tax=Ectobacillus ponti TaxID=2961894 RepID=A0AA42BQ36_9BACI|nr:DUF3231 family protein [Ectobacillus ponti]MCP8969447.1 DUF3231 family protein [Ectobacillus ponti]